MNLAMPTELFAHGTLGIAAICKRGGMMRRYFGKQRMGPAGPMVAVLAAALCGAASVAQTETTLVLEGWRDDDRRAWEEIIIPALRLPTGVSWWSSVRVCRRATTL